MLRSTKRKSNPRLDFSLTNRVDLSQMQISPELPLEYKTMGSIVVHAISVFKCKFNLVVLVLFVNMLNNPALLVVSSLFTLCII